MEHDGRALLVFARSPEAEARAKGLQPEAGARLFLALLASWEEASRLAGVRLILATPAFCRPWMESSPVGRNAVILTQRAGTFGERLQASAEEATALGFRELVVVGGDTPAVSPGELRGIFATLERRAGACVLGPASDGGVYLVGLGREALPVLGAMRLRRSDLFERTLELLRRGGFETLVLEPRGEIDSPSDLERASKREGSDSSWNAFRVLLADALRPCLDIGFSRSGHPRFATILRLPARAPPAPA